MATNKTPAAARPKARTGSRVRPRKTAASAGAKAEALALPARKAARPAARAAAPKAAAKPAAPAPVATYKVAVDFDKAGQDAIETYALCGRIAAEGLASLSKEVFGFTRTSVEAQLALTQALLGATTLEEAIAAQNEFTRESFSNLTAEVAKLTGLSVELSHKLMEPVQARVNEATRTIWEPIAA